jgi:hypothetical protein
LRLGVRPASVPPKGVLTVLRAHSTGSKLTA